MIKRVLIGGAGGAPALNFIRSLKKSKEKFFLIGISCNKFDLCKAKKFVDKPMRVSLNHHKQLKRLDLFP